MSQQELTSHLIREGATLVILGMPPGTEFGIDVNYWNVGDRFKGVKMIPAGLHFVYYSAVSREGDTAPRTGFFHVFEPRELILRHYDHRTEELREEAPSQDEMARIRSSLSELNTHLGPYPIDTWSKWVALTQYIKPEDIGRVAPLSGRVCSVPELIPTAGFRSSRTERRAHTPSRTQSETSTSSTSQDADATGTLAKSKQANSDQPQPNPTIDNLPEMKPREGTELRFTTPPKRAYREGASPSEVTRYSLDSSYSVKDMMNRLDRPESLLAEMQVAFVCFLVGQVWDGWEHWKRLIVLMCSAEEVLKESAELFDKLLSLLHHQVSQIPEDLFVDVVESNNFLASSLTTLFANINDNAAVLPSDLILKAGRFKEHLTAKFEWDLSLEDEGEYAPVVVDM